MSADRRELRAWDPAVETASARTWRASAGMLASVASYRFCKCLEEKLKRLHFLSQNF